MLKQAKEFISQADSILITAGAGMGVDSGLPDFRGDDGFWKEYPIIKDLGLRFQDMANHEWFRTTPSLAWAFYGHRLNLYRDTVPHDGFGMLLELVNSKCNDYFVYTSNVDGQFQKAGFSSKKIVEVHGSIHHFQCAEHCLDGIWDADEEGIKIDMTKFKALTIPKCRQCGGIARPNILMFNDLGWEHERTIQQERRFNNWLNELEDEGKKLAIIEIGAGTAISTVRRKGELIAKNYKNSKLIRVNPREYMISENLGFSVALGGLEGVKKLLN